jgi:hypothetical protein
MGELTNEQVQSPPLAAIELQANLPQVAPLSPRALIAQLLQAQSVIMPPDNVPDEFNCPAGLIPMRLPVILADDSVVEFSIVLRYLIRQNNLGFGYLVGLRTFTSLSTNNVRQFLVRQAQIRDWIAQHGSVDYQRDFFVAPLELNLPEGWRVEGLPRQPALDREQAPSYPEGRVTLVHPGRKVALNKPFCAFFITIMLLSAASSVICIFYSTNPKKYVDLLCNNLRFEIDEPNSTYQTCFGRRRYELPDGSISHWHSPYPPCEGEAPCRDPYSQHLYVLGENFRMGAFASLTVLMCFFVGPLSYIMKVSRATRISFMVNAEAPELPEASFFTQHVVRPITDFFRPPRAQVANESAAMIVIQALDPLEEQAGPVAIV